MEILKSKISTKTSFFRNTFLLAGFAFIVTALVGFGVYEILKQYVKLDVVNAGGRFNADIWKNHDEVAGTQVLFRIGIVGVVSMILSMILTLVWMFRIATAGKFFIYSVYITTMIAQGIGFGILFTTFDAIELLGIFGIAGGLFTIMGFVGWFIKDASHLMPFLIVGTILVAIMSLITMILFFAGVYSDSFYMFLIVGTGVLTLGWIVFDVWSIKRTSQYMELNGSNDGMMEFRLMAFFAYKLYSDLITLVWTIARIYSRMRR